MKIKYYLLDNPTHGYESCLSTARFTCGGRIFARSADFASRKSENRKINGITNQWTPYNQM
jgi:hypothetical protein